MRRAADTSGTRLHHHEEPEAADPDSAKHPLVLEHSQNLFVPLDASESLAGTSLLLIPNSAIAAVLPVLTFCLTRTVPRSITPYENALAHVSFQEVKGLVSEQPELLLPSRPNPCHLRLVVG